MYLLPALYDISKLYAYESNFTRDILSRAKVNRISNRSIALTKNLMLNIYIFFCVAHAISIRFISISISIYLSHISQQLFSFLF